MPVIGGHELSLRAAAKATDMLNCINVHRDSRFGDVRLGADRRSVQLLQGEEVDGKAGALLPRAYAVWAGHESASCSSPKTTLRKVFISPISASGGA